MAKSFKVKQVRSQINQTERVKNTLRSLGLGKIGRVVNHNAEDNCVRGKLKKVEHLVHVVTE